MSLLDISPDSVSRLSDEDFRKLLVDMSSFQKADVKENSLLYYKPASKKAEQIHRMTAGIVGVAGGNRSSKTTTQLVDGLIAMTGIIPNSMKSWYPMEKLRGPINARLIIESLTTVLHPIMLPKLQWWRWNGVDEPGGLRGHWGFIPRSSLIDGDWEKSWSEKNRILRVLYRNPLNPDVIEGESTLQINSHDQDPTDFGSGDFHLVIFDEPPRYAIWRENRARVMAVRGRLLLAMTWPDDAGIAIDWLFDEVYDKAFGANKDPDVEWVELHTTENEMIDQESIQARMNSMSEVEKSVRIFGKPLRFSNRIHPLFTDIDSAWCFTCNKESMLKDVKCMTCGSEDVTTFNHVKSFDHSPSWPTIYLLDPHPRKPHMMSWIQVDTYDDLWQVVDLEVDGNPTEVKVKCDEIERLYGLNVVKRLIDPKMGESPSGAIRGVTWKDEFRNAGLYCDLADNSDVGRSRVNEYLKPDPRTNRPRIHVHTRCRNTVFEMKRFVWDEYRQNLEKDLKQKAKMKYDNYPALWRYMMNEDPSFRLLVHGAPILRRAR